MANSGIKKKKNVLFVCIENACRSQMAEALLNRFAEGKVRGVSAGTKPAIKVNPMAVKVMKEIGVDISRQKPKLLSGEMIQGADKVIIMGCEAEACPIVPKVTDDWKIEDPSGKSIEKFRDVRDEIKRKVENLIKRIIMDSQTDIKLSSVPRE